MEKYLKKYDEMDRDFFSTGIDYNYYWRFGDKNCSLIWVTSVESLLDDFPHKDLVATHLNMYAYLEEGKNEILFFSDIYEALEKIAFNGKALKQMMIEDGFTIDGVS